MGRCSFTIYRGRSGSIPFRITPDSPEPGDETSDSEADISEGHWEGDPIWGNENGSLWFYKEDSRPEGGSFEILVSEDVFDHFKDYKPEFGVDDIIDPDDEENSYYTKMVHNGKICIVDGHKTWPYFIGTIPLVAYALALRYLYDYWNLYFYKFNEWVRVRPENGSYVDDGSYQEKREAI